ncbi:hypothetical protein Tco_0394634 [Tanacetum coccineum]
MDKAKLFKYTEVGRSLNVDNDLFRPCEEDEDVLGPEVPYLSAIGALTFSCKFSDMEDDVDISALTMEQYIALIPDDIKPVIVNPKIGDDVKFEINANLMRELRRKFFAGTDDEDAYEHMRKKVHIFYTGLDISTPKILDSNGFIPLMTPTQALESIQVMADHSHDWYDETTTRERINDVLYKVDAIHEIIMEYLVNISKRRAFWSLNEDILKINDSDYQYAVSIKEDMSYPCLHSPKTLKETSSIRRIQRRPIRRIEDIVCEDSGRYQAWSLLQEIPNTSTYSLPSDTAYPLPSDTAYPTFCPIQLRMTKVIKGEFEKLEDLKVEDVSLTCDTSLEVFNNEFNRLSRMNDDLFTYKVEVANIPCESNMDDASEHEADNDMGYDLSDVAFTEWLGSKFFNYKTMNHYTMKALWIYWIRGNDEVELTDEESSDNEDDVVEVFRIDTNIFDYETPLYYYSDYQYAVSIKEDTAYPCLHSPKTTKETSSIHRIQRNPIRRIQDIVCEDSGRYQTWMDDPNITMEEYIRLEEEKAPKRGKVFNWETTKYGKIWYDEDLHDLRSVETEFPAISFNDESLFDDFDDEDYTVIFDKNMFSYKIISTNDLKTDSENDNEKVNLPSLLSPEPIVSCFDDLDFFKDFEKGFLTIVYNDAQMSKSYLLIELILSTQHIDEFNLKDETSLSECDEEEQNFLNFNDLFPFNVIYPNDSKSDKDNDDDKVDIEHSSGDLSVKPLPDVINTDVGAYAHGTVNTTYSLNEYSVFDTGINTAYPGVWIRRPHERNIDEYWWKFYKSRDLEVLES